MRRISLTLCAAFTVLSGWAAQAQDPGAEAVAAPAEASEASVDELRARITERADRHRPPEPFNLRSGRHLLTLSGELEAASAYLRRSAPGQASPNDGFQDEQQLELELFYTLGLPFSALAQVQLRHSEAPKPGEPGSRTYLERGEMWLYSEDIGGSGIDFDLGRLDFEDDRRWWWDAELDALRLAFEAGHFELSLAAARELAPARSDLDAVAPEQDGVLRWIGEASWDFAPNQTAQFFLLQHRDGSGSGTIGQELDSARQDESDARLTWLGARLMGAVELPSQLAIGYWLDAASLRGREQRIEFEPTANPGQSAATSISSSMQRGWAFDLGALATLPGSGEPRIFTGYAYGSGDSLPGDGQEQAFRQSGLQANEAGFGGVQRFESYGVALDPELSNLRILTLGAGISLLQASSLDLVYHHYRLVHAAAPLRDTRLELALNGVHPALGDGLDAVLSIEEWQHLEFALIAGGFRAGPALGAEQGRWSFAGSLALRVAF